MANTNASLINLEGLSKPATVLIEKVSNAVGGIFLPYQIERVAKAEAKAEKIKAISNIEITELQKRALRRLLQEESNKQKNIESITQKALPQLTDMSNPKDIEQDWLVNFFDKARMISDIGMQELWGKILAGEANAPGTFSKRAINLTGTLDKKDAILFTKLCHFVWNIEGNLVPIVFNSNDAIYTQNDINFSAIKHLDSIGLISFESLAGYTLTNLPQKIRMLYPRTNVDVEFLQGGNNTLAVGLTLFTSVGEELFRICEIASIDGFLQYAIEKWRTTGIKVEASTI